MYSNPSQYSIFETFYKSTFCFWFQGNAVNLTINRSHCYTSQARFNNL